MTQFVSISIHPTDSTVTLGGTQDNGSPTTPLAERLRKIAELFPPNPGFEFAVYYKRRSDR